MHGLRILGSDSDEKEGITLIELVLVILLIAILSVFILPKLFDLGAFTARGTYENLEAALRYARKEAYASTCPVTVNPQGRRVRLTQRSSCTGTKGKTIPVLSPGGGPYVVDVPTGVQVAFQPTGAFTFDALGGVGTSVVIHVSGGGFTGTITVHSPSGFVSGAP